MSKILVVILTTLFILISCATSPLGRSQFKLMSDDELNGMGSEAFLRLNRKRAWRKVSVLIAM